MHGAIGVAVGVVLGLFFHQRIYDFVFAPTLAVLPPDSNSSTHSPGKPSRCISRSRSSRVS
jgi:hypothetical protein